MSFINERAREINCKVVYFGPARGGKSTSLRHIYQQVKQSDSGDLVALSTDNDQTLFFDFVPLRVGEIRGYTVRLHLYTVPGQVAQRKLIAKGTDGVVFVVDSQIQRMEANLTSRQDLENIMREEGTKLTELPLVIQYNKRDLPRIAPLSELQRVLNPKGVSEFESIATTGKGVLESLQEITRQVLHELMN